MLSSYNTLLFSSCRRCLMPPWKTESWVLNLPQVPPCSCTGLWAWSMSSTLLLSSSYWERLDCKNTTFLDLLLINLGFYKSFPLFVHQVLRPGVLWFLRNLNDPDFNPVQEMIHLPIYRHLRRFILSVVVFGSIVLLMLWLPIRLIKLLLPAFLPYNVMLYR